MKRELKLLGLIILEGVLAMFGFAAATLWIGLLPMGLWALVSPSFQLQGLLMIAIGVPSFLFCAKIFEKKDVEE